MKGIIHQINLQRGMVAVRTEQNDFSVFELLGGLDHIEEGDIVSWIGSTPLGGQQISNHTRNLSLYVYFQNHHVSYGQLHEQLLC